jgi:OFA family oxalate/formate antiporter-like MFS transporter
MGFPLLLSAVMGAGAKPKASSQAQVAAGGSRYWVLVGAVLVQIVLGTIYAFSVFVQPLETEFGWARATIQAAFSVALAMFALAMIPAGRMQDRIGPRKVAIIGGVLLGVSFLLTPLLVNAFGYWGLYLSYGVIGGAGIGFGYVCPLAAASKWFPDKKGLITGIAVAGFGAGALFFAGPASALLLPPAEGESLSLYQIIMVGMGLMPGEGSGIGWERFFIMHGVVAALLVIGGALLLRNPPAGWLPKGWTPSQSKAKVMSEKTPSEMLNTPLATIIWMTFIFGATSGLMAIGQWTPMIAELGGNSSIAPVWLGTAFARFFTPVAILAIFNAGGRVFWGWASDKIDRPRAMMIMFLAQGMAFMVLVSIKSPIGIVLASAWVGLNFGGIFSMFPSATSDYFGLKNFGANYGFIFTAYGVAGIMGPIVGGVIRDQTQEYILALVFAGILCFIAALGAVVIWAQARSERWRLEVEGDVSG